jgi:hypothetical protein
MFLMIGVLGIFLSVELKNWCILLFFGIIISDWNAKHGWRDCGNELLLYKRRLILFSNLDPRGSFKHGSNEDDKSITYIVFALGYIFLVSIAISIG